MQIIMTCKKCGPLTEDKVKTEKNGIYIKVCCSYCRRKSQILNKRKISEENYDLMVSNQNNRCAICGKKESLKSRGDHILPLAIDHCHHCNQNRALLCHNCNTSIGKAKDDINLLQSAIAYLKKHQHQ